MAQEGGLGPWIGLEGGHDDRQTEEAFMGGLSDQLCVQGGVGGPAMRSVCVCTESEYFVYVCVCDGVAV